MIKRNLILARVKKIETLPAALQDAMQLLRDPEVDMQKLAQTLEYDPNLTVTLLRVANAPYFGAAHKITTMRDAIVRLGSKRVWELLLTVAAAQYLKHEVKGYDLPPQALLEQSLALAVASELLANELSVEAPDFTFTAGLLANVGKMVMGQFLEIDGSKIVQLAEEKEISFEEAERQTLGVDHAEAGAVLLREWSIPEDIVQVVEYRLKPDEFQGRSLALDLVHAADASVRMAGVGQGMDGMQYAVSEAVFERLGVTEETFMNVLDKLIERLETLRATLSKG